MIIVVVVTHKIKTLIRGSVLASEVNGQKSIDFNRARCFPLTLTFISLVQNINDPART